MQVCWEKFTRYFDVEERFVHLTNDCYVLTPEKAIELVDENTIGRPLRSCLASFLVRPVALLAAVMPAHRQAAPGKGGNFLQCLPVSTATGTLLDAVH